jgi:DNA-binding HxlR family transcriptional regulator
MLNETNSKIENQKDILKWHCLEHKNVKNCINECRFQIVLNLFGKKYIMPIIRLLLFHKKLRFNEILEKMGGSSKTITDRLRVLEKYGLINREVFNEIPMRVEYSLNDQGKALEDVFERFSVWALNLKIDDQKEGVL